MDAIATAAAVAEALMVETELAGKVALVTGGGAGIGRAIARALGRAGALVGIVDCERKSGQEALKLLKRDGSTAVFMAADVGDLGQIERSVDHLRRRFGRIDILCNNVGVLAFGTALETSEAEWRRLASVNLEAAFHYCRLVLPGMLKQRKGAIVNIASNAGIGSAPDNCAYVTSKHGLVGLTRAVAMDFAREGIRCNCVCPGPVGDTPMARWALGLSGDAAKARRELEARIPMGRMGKPEEIAEAVLFLASDASSYCTGTILAVDGGWTCA